MQTVSDISCRLSRALRVSLNHSFKEGRELSHYAMNFGRIENILFSGKHQEDSERRFFAFDVFSYLLYEDIFLGLDLGSLHEAVVCSRYVSGMLREKLRYMHSFHVLRHTSSPGLSSKLAVPIAEHPVNCPLFPSGDWTVAMHPAGELSRFSKPWKAIEQFSRRIIARLSTGTTGDRSRLAFLGFQRAISSAGTFMQKFGVRGCDVSATACASLAFQLSEGIGDPKKSFGSFERYLRQLNLVNQVTAAKAAPAYSSGFVAARSLEASTSGRVRAWLRHHQNHRLRKVYLSNVEPEELTREILQLFIVGVFERASFQSLEIGNSFRSKEDKSPLAKIVSKYGQTVPEDGDRDEIDYYNAGRLLYQQLVAERSTKSNSHGEDPGLVAVQHYLSSKSSVHSLDHDVLLKPQPLAAPLSEQGVQDARERNSFILERRALLSEWLCRRVAQHRERLATLLNFGQNEGARRIAAACFSLQINASDTTTAGALSRLIDWDESEFISRQDSPFRNLSECRDLFAGYAPALVGHDEAFSLGAPGLSIAVHNLGATGRNGRENVAVELYRVDVLRDQARWLPDVRETDVNAVSLLDHVFMHAEQLIIAEETKRRLDSQRKEFDESMRRFTSEMAHELQYQLDRIVPIERLARKLAHHCSLLCLASQEHASQLPLSSGAGLKESLAIEDSYMAVLSCYQELLKDAKLAPDDKLLSEKILDYHGRSMSALEIKSDMKTWIEGAAHGLRSYLGSVLGTIVRTSRGMPELTIIKNDQSKQKETFRTCDLGKFFSSVVEETAKQVQKIPIRTEFADSIRNQVVPFPEFSFRHLVLPELLRNSQKYGRSFSCLKAELSTEDSSLLGTNVPIVGVTIWNDIVPDNSSTLSTGVGLEHVRRVLLANLPEGFRCEEDFLLSAECVERNGDVVFQVRIRFPFRLYEKAVVKSTEARNDSL